MLRIRTNNLMNVELEGWLIESCENILEYYEMQQPSIATGVRALLSSSSSRDLRHLFRHNHFGALATLAQTKCEFSGGSLLGNIAQAFDSKMDAIKVHVLNGRKVLINDLGGYCFFEGDYEIVENPQKFIDYYIGKNTKYINLENDPFLEVYTHKNIPDKDFSWVLNMHECDIDDFKRIFTEFKENGGVGIWQYTTGMDVAQMHTFMIAGLEVGLTEYIFNFNAGIDERIEEFCEVYEKLDHINFTYKEVGVC